VLRPDGQRPGESDTQERMVAYALHYTSIRLESFLLFSLPGVPSGVPVAVGLRITNLLPDRNLDMLLGVYRSVGDRAEVSGSGRTAALPIVYAGREVTITVYVVALAKDEAEFLSGQMFAVSFSRSDPASERTVDLEGKLFASVFDTYRPRERDRWIYAFTLYPADSVYSIRPDLLLLAGRSILVLTGTSDGKPAAASGRPPEPFEGQVELRDGKLLWKKTGKAFTDRPYLVVDVERRDRWLRPDAPLRKLLRRFEESLSKGDHEQAQKLLQTVDCAIVMDRLHTQNERNLERALQDARKARVGAAIAFQKGERDRASKLRAEAKSLLSQTRNEFRPLLLPEENRKIDQEIADLESEPGAAAPSQSPPASAPGSAK
jgi:hypothetical protein